MTVDELIKKLRQDKKDGKIQGDWKVVFDCYIAGDPDTEVQTVNNYFKSTVRLGEPTHGPRGTQYGPVVDGRGNPRGTEKVVRLV